MHDHCWLRIAHPWMNILVWYECTVTTLFIHHPSVFHSSCSVNATHLPLILDLVYERIMDIVHGHGSFFSPTYSSSSFSPLSQTLAPGTTANVSPRNLIRSVTCPRLVRHTPTLSRLCRARKRRLLTLSWECTLDKPPRRVGLDPMDVNPTHRFSDA